MTCLIIASAALSKSSFGLGDNPNKKGRNFSLGVATGLPHFISLEVGYIGLNWLSFFAGFGSFPLNTVVNSVIKISPIPLATVAGNSFSVVPSTSYSLYGFNASVRAHPLDGGFFTQATYANWIFNGTLALGLRNDTSGTTYNNIVSGTLGLNFHQIGLLIGYQFFFKFGLFIDLGIGASYLAALTSNVSVGGSAADFASIVGTNNLDLDAVRTSINSQVQSALDLIRNQVPVLPDVLITVGYAF